MEQEHSQNTTPQPPTQPQPVNTSGKLTVSEVVKQTWKIFLDNFEALVILMLLPAVPGIIVQIVLEKGSIQAALLALFVFGVTSLYLTMRTGAGGLVAMLEYIKNRQPFTFKQAWDAGKGNTLKFFITSLVVGLIVAGGLILLIIPGLIFLLWFSLTLQARFGQNLSIEESLKESRRLVRGNYGVVIGTWFVLIFIAIILGLIPIVNYVSSVFIAAFNLVAFVYIYDRLKSKPSVATDVQA